MRTQSLSMTESELKGMVIQYIDYNMTTQESLDKPHCRESLFTRIYGYFFYVSFFNCIYTYPHFEKSPI